MKKMCLVKPQHFTRLWMLRNSLANLPGAQLSIFLPGERDSCSLTHCFYLCPVICLKNILPGQVKSLTIISDIPDSLFCEELTNSRIDQPVDLAVIGQRCCSSLSRRLHTIKPDLTWPMRSIGHLAVQLDKLIGWILS